MVRAIKIVVYAVVVTAIALFCLSATTNYFATRKTKGILETTGGASPLSTAVKTTAYIHQNFGHVPPLKSEKFLMNLSRKVRMSKDDADILAFAGSCRDAVHTLAYILNLKKIPSRPVTIFAPSSTADALIVSLSGRDMLADPCRGYVTIKDDVALAPAAARDEMKKGAAMNTVFRPLDDAAEPGLYHNFGDAQMAYPGAGTALEDRIPPMPKGAVTTFDIGPSGDISDSLLSADMTSIWSYVGANAAIGDGAVATRTLAVPQAMTVEMTLSQPPGKLLETLSPKPAVEGNLLRWDFAAADKIISADQTAKPLPWEPKSLPIVRMTVIAK